MKSKEIFAETALLPSGWAQNVSVSVDPSGRIAEVRKDAQPGAFTHRVGVLLAAPANLHSHAFQRAMAGFTETRGSGASDSFWTWRQVMYRFLEQLTPEDVEAITGFVQMEMLEAGYAASVEFHYLHHRPDGEPYADLAEMSGRVCAAAADTGIGLTLLPVLYQYGGIDRRPLGAGQVRFGNDPDRYARLLEGAEAALTGLPPDARIGVAPHSLRAVDAERLTWASELRPDAPLHMHIAEQVAEVEEIRQATGARPVDWLLDTHAVDGRWCLIHCTQMTEAETVRLATSGAVAGLCPITESSLGDGIFNGESYVGQGGRFGIGSDSNIRISLSEELRTLEYSQRLASSRRAVFAEAGRSTGRVLFEAALSGGAAAAGRDCGAIEAGRVADLLSLDAEATGLLGRAGDQILDSWIFAGDDRLVRDVWSAGRHVVREGRHVARNGIEARYRRTIRCLTGAI
ncbi:formimidoylglutamate deiminase [Sulfitobacter sp. D35]|uniref:formimidoylglutamate deiminase n=1 Tax=Sulfitobacter sp. D35 TaxID=3083252 RepID=UPI00296EB9F9|nr:formimidoylglutamate deiminase [Sulfitobacter sp. D35]MDW4497255.1 formimidoylglutamate deiminase [Sulfitobacter sp. D35]